MNLEKLGSLSKELGITAVQSNRELVKGSDIILLVVKPNVIKAVLSEIASDLNSRGWRLHVEDAYRTRQMQQRVALEPYVLDVVAEKCRWELQGAQVTRELLFKRMAALVASWPKVAPHISGSALDISVYRRGSSEQVDRGADYLEMSELSPMDSPFVTDEERWNRRAITDLMARHGFIHFPGEFWHYNQGDILCEILADTGQPGVYGPVHWDETTGRVTPYDDPNAPLIPPDEMEAELHRALARAAK